MTTQQLESLNRAYADNTAAISATEGRIAGMFEEARSFDWLAAAAPRYVRSAHLAAAPSTLLGALDKHNATKYTPAGNLMR